MFVSFCSRLPKAVINIEAEQNYWQDLYLNLPGSRCEGGFATYWPVICAVYEIHFTQPRWDSDRAQAHYAQCGAVQQHGLDEHQASEVFSRVWGRISGEWLGQAALARQSYQRLTSSMP